MARVHDDIFVRGLTGSLDNPFVIRRTRSGKTIIANKRTFDPNRTFTASQKLHQSTFRQAAAYEKGARSRQIYIEQASGTDRNAYDLAIADWFGEPEVLEIDTGDWTGGIGQTIRVKAQDSVYVASVGVAIRDEAGTVVERGEAVWAEPGGLWWVYTTRTQVSAESPLRVQASAHNLPGNSHSLDWQES